MATLLDNLVRVAEVDQRRIGLQKQLDAAPRALKDGEVKIEQARAAIQRQKDEAKKATLELKKLEGELKAKQQEIEKTQLAQNSARSNDEFQAHGKKIESLKREVGDIETKILEEYEKADVREKDKAPAEKKLKDLEVAQKTTKDRVDAELKRLRGEMERVEAERKERLVGLDKDQLALYQRALEKHGDRAVVPVVDNYCQGCLVSIRPNQAAQLKGRDQVVICWECARILYLE